MRILLLYSLLNLTFLVFSCAKDISISGEYEVATKTVNDRLFLRKMKSDGRIVGSQLSLKSDSTFLYLTCGNKMTGHWRKTQDSVFLHISTNVYRTDSMKLLSPAFFPDRPITFLVRERQLYRIWETANTNRTVELLTKKD